MIQIKRISRIKLLLIDFIREIRLICIIRVPFFSVY